MALDKLTLYAQMAVLEQNGISIETAIADKTRALQDMTVDLQRTHGAKDYHALLVQQLKAIIAETERAEQASATPPPAT